MSEPKWWPKGEIPTEDGKYLSIRVCDGDVCGWSFPKDNKHDMLSFQRETRQFYGPIPEPPREPPKIRRFTATHVRYGRVNGVFCDEDCAVCKKYCYYFFEGDLAATAYFDNGDRLSDIQWLDKEQP